MANGYTRQSENDIGDGLPVTAAIFNNEFDAIESAFNSTSGHTHDGTSGGGAPLPPTALSGVSSNGFVARASTSTFAPRTLTGGAGITVTNGDGVSGNPTIGITADVVTLTGTQTLTNKTLTQPVISSIVNGSGTVTLPTATTTLVGRDTTDTLTNKTLTGPVIATIVNSGNTLTLPTATTTLVGRDTTDTLTNKTLTSPTMNGTVPFGGVARSTVTSVSYSSSVTLNFNTSNDFAIGALTGTLTLANPSNITVGQSGMIRLVQDGSGSRTVSFGSSWKKLGSGAINTTANKVSVVTYTVLSAGEVLYSIVSEV